MQALGARRQDTNAGRTARGIIVLLFVQETRRAILQRRKVLELVTRWVCSVTIDVEGDLDAGRVAYIAAGQGPCP